MKIIEQDCEALSSAIIALAMRLAAKCNSSVEFEAALKDTVPGYVRGAWNAASREDTKRLREKAWADATDEERRVCMSYAEGVTCECCVSHEEAAIDILIAREEAWRQKASK